MSDTAKLFKSGHSQAVRLPKAFRMPGDEVWIRRDEATGELILTPKGREDDIDRLLRLIEQAEVPEDFMRERDNAPGEDRDPL